MTTMNSSTDTLGTTPSSLLPFDPRLSILLLCLVPAIAVLSWFTLGGSKEPPSLKGGIPILTNTYQYMTDMQGFLNRVDIAQRTSAIIKFHLGPKKIYMVSGEKNIQTINTPSPAISPDTFFLEVMRNVWHAKPSEVSRFARDKSGRAKRQIPGQEVKPGQERLWHGQHHVYSEFLQSPRHSTHLAETYLGLFNEKLEEGQPLGEWREGVSLTRFFETDMAEAGLVAIMGRKIVELNPGFWPAMWEFARLAPQLMWGLPKWLNPAPYKIREEFHGMCRKYVDAAKAEGGLDADSDLDWDPRFGAKLGRELLRWADGTLSEETMAGMAATFIFGTNANSVPMCTWAMMHIISDPSLYRAIRSECLASCYDDTDTSSPNDPPGPKRLNPQKLMSQPLLQSVYLETLRLHVSINVTREVTQPIVLDGYKLSPGSLIQAPSQIGAYNEGVWGSPGHPAKEFWVGRNLKEVEVEVEVDDENDGTKKKKMEKRTEFSMHGRNSSFFPYGGGPSICPGRVFAKQEIIMTIAALVTRFEIELVGWTHRDEEGTPSDRPAQNDQSYIGAVGIPPDRDMKVRWKRVW